MTRIKRKGRRCKKSVIGYGWTVIGSRTRRGHEDL